MRGLACAFLCAAVLVGRLPAAAQLISNGGFERVDSAYFPEDWGAVGPGLQVTTDSHTGKYALQITRATTTPMPPETGLNRAWDPRAGQRGAMLAERKGVLRAWYKVRSASPSANMAIVVIPMGETCIENTGQMRSMRKLTNDVAGDGQWYEAKLAYDYTASPSVRWVHVGVRLTGGPADVIVDDFELITEPVPLLQWDKLHVYPDAKRPESRAVLMATVANDGSGASEHIRVALEVPAGLRAVGPAEVGVLRAGEAKPLKWELSGPMTDGMLVLRATDGSETETARVAVRSRVELVSVLARPAVVAPGSVVEVTACLWNRGTALSDPATLNLMAGHGLSVALPRAFAPRVPPGRKAYVTWRVAVGPRAGRDATERELTCRLESRSGEQTPHNVRLVVTDAARAKAEPIIGGFRIRRGSERTIAEIAPAGSATPYAVLPHLGRVTISLPGGRAQALAPRIQSVERKPGAATMTGEEVDRLGGRWRFTVSVAQPASGAYRVSTSVVCSSARKVLAYTGPALLVGERRDGAHLREAVFAGLEWLVAGEVSSSDLDISAEHPDRPRFAPHPNKVTIPAMGVSTRSSTVALLWSMSERWDGLRDRPQPVFASPDRLTGAAAHYMALMAPSAAHGLPENAVDGSPQKPYPLKAGQALTLTAVVIAGPPDGGALPGVLAWFRWFAPARVQPAPRGDDRAQIAWSMRAYMSTLWEGADKGWLPFLGGPGIWRIPSMNPGYAFDLLYAARILPAHTGARQWRQRLAAVRERGVAPTADDLQLAEGDPLIGLRGVANVAIQQVAAQGPDGSFAFDANRRDAGVFKGYDFHELGPDGAVEVGTIAQNAYRILRAARITGDRRLYEAGVRSLRRMQAFSVPRAAQVWEVPVHTPDILAAADAVDAYLEAYEYDGKTQWLNEARLWARRGLPFVYVWNAPGKLWMRYGSIPVFGATQFLGSWFGNIVQWNGLRLAASLLRLHCYESGPIWGGLTWRDLAIGVTRSAMHQQSTDPKILGLWPDAMHTITNARAAWDFAPRQILKNVFTYSGYPEEPLTVRIPAPGGSTVRVSALAKVSGATFRTSTLTFSAQHAAGMRGSVLVAGISRPSRVMVAGSPIPEAAATLPLDRFAWRYDRTTAALAVRIPNDRRAQIRVEGIGSAAPMLIAPVADRIAFRFDLDEAGWTPDHDIGAMAVSEGALRIEVTGGDPYLVRTNCRVVADTVSEVVVRVRANHGGNGQLYWMTQSAPSFSEERVLPFSYPADGAWHDVVVPVAGHAGWRGEVITGLRIDPLNGGTATVDLHSVVGR